ASSACSSPRKRSSASSKRTKSTGESQEAHRGSNRGPRRHSRWRSHPDASRARDPESPSFGEQDDQGTESATESAKGTETWLGFIISNGRRVRSAWRRSRARTASV